MRRRWWVVSVFVLASVAATLPLLVFGWRAAGETQHEAERRVLELAQLAATQADHILMEAFFEIELMASRVLVSTGPTATCLEGAESGPAGREPANFTSELFVLDCDGAVVVAEPSGESLLRNQQAASAVFLLAAGAEDRYISQPFVSPTSGHPTVGLGLPLFGRGGVRVGTVVGLVDLEQHFSVDLYAVVEQLGRSGHADLVGADGTVLASTSHGWSGTPGAHVGFYRAMSSGETSSVRRVRYEPNSHEPNDSDWHVMAYGPLGGAPWGVALGASESETLEAARDLRRLLFRLGAAAGATILTGAVVLAWSPPR